MQGQISSFSSVLQPIMPLIYLIALGVVISLLFSLVNMFSVDRVLKLVKGRKTFVFIGKEAHYGKLHVLPRGGGGFEVFYMKEGMENPLSLIAFLMENYHETGNEKFLEKARVILNYLKEMGVVDTKLTEGDIRIDPWSPPSLISRKVYPNELNDLWMIVSFVDFMSEEEKKRRWKELSELYSKPFIKVAKRRTYNALSYVKDKIASALASSAGTITAIVPSDLKKSLEEAEKKTLESVIAQTYDPLLENSIGRLVAVRVDDVEGERKLYQGVLAEYSDKYLYVMDVDYRLQMVAHISNGNLIKEEPIVQVFGRTLQLGRHVSIEWSEGVILKNSWSKPIKIEKLVSGDQEITVGKVLFPGERVTVNGAPRSFTLYYEISLESDVVWPRKKASVVGLGDYPPSILSSILRDLSINNLKKMI